MINPVLWLELRIRIRERKLWVVTCLYLLCLFAISFIAVTIASENPSGDPADTGMAIFSFSSFSLLALLVILGPLASAGAITQEREQRTLPALLNTPLSPATIVWGKLIAAWAFILWLACLSLPFLVLGLVWGAVNFLHFAEAWGVDVAAGMTAATIAVGLSGYFRRSLTSYLATGALMFFWLIVWPIFGMLFGTLFHPSQGTFERGDVVFYVFFAHHLAAPLISILMFAGTHDGARPPEDFSPAVILPFAGLVWLVIGILFFLLARRGVTRAGGGKN
jgi:ABC-type transport system involved in multi-copper enzyme maturation permease subunit